jgi:acyl carrier protein
MQPEELKAKLTSVFREVFDDETIEIHDATSANDIEDWDSLTHVNLIVAAEKAFGVKFTTREVQGLKNVGEFSALIARRTG